MEQIRLLQHQSEFIDAPYMKGMEKCCYYFLITGYGAGKTNAICYAVVRAVMELSGKRDGGGVKPKIMIGSKNLTFMRKTLIGVFTQLLDLSKTPYKYDKAHNIIEIAGVEILLIPTENEGDIYGFDVACFTSGTKISVIDKKGRCVQKKICNIETGDKVMTISGENQVLNKWYKGEKKVLELKFSNRRKITCTEDHEFIDVFDNKTKAKDLTYLDNLVTINQKAVSKWVLESGRIEKNRKLLILTALGIIDILKASQETKGWFFNVRQKIKKEVFRRIILIYGKALMGKFQKGMFCTTKTETHLITLLKILNYYQGQSILRRIKKWGHIKLLQRKEQWQRLCRCLKRGLNPKNIEKNYQSNKKTDWMKEKQKENVQDVEVFLLRDVIMQLTALNVKGLLETKLHEEHMQIKKNTECVKYAGKNTKHQNTQLLQLVHLTAKTLKEGKQCVFDIEVENVHEFFANGIRVHNCSFVDELDELPTTTAMAVVKAVQDRCRQKVQGFRSNFMCYATSSQGLKGTYQTIDYFNRRKTEYCLITAPTRWNKYLDEQYIKNIYAIYNETERECFLEARFLAVGSSLVFPDYDVKRNKISRDDIGYIYDDETVYIGQDFNEFGNSAVACIVRNGVVYIIKDYEIPDIRRAPEIFRYSFPNNKIKWIPDASSNRTFWQFAKELRKHRILISSKGSNPIIKDRVFAINKLLYTGRLKMCDNCEYMEKSFLLHQYDDKTGAPKKGGKGAPDHWSDALGYVIYYLLRWNSQLLDMYRLTLKRVLLHKNEQELMRLGEDTDKLGDEPLVNANEICYDGFKGGTKKW